MESGGTYQFEIMDNYRNGIKPPGYFSISLDGNNILLDSESCSSFKITNFYAGDAKINVTNPEGCPVGMEYNKCCQSCGAIFTSKSDLQNAIIGISDACVVESMITTNYFGPINCWNVTQINDFSGVYANTISNTCWNVTDSIFSVKLMTDEYPSETGWNLRQIFPKSSLIVSRDFGAYDSGETLYEESYYINAGGTYQFEIIDEYGDGLEPPGYYYISLDGISILRDSENCSSFTSKSKTFTFYAGNTTANATDLEACPVGMKYNNCCQGCGAVFTSKSDLSNALFSKDSCVVESRNIINYVGAINCWNVTQITDFSGVYANKIHNENITCWKVKESIFSLQLMTDSYPEGTGWNLRQIFPKSSLIVSRGFGTYDSGETLYEESYYINAGGAYQFEIMDEYGDGLEPPGYYYISLDGISIMSDSEKYSSLTAESKSYTFFAGNATANPTDLEVCPLEMKYNSCCGGCGFVFASQSDLSNAITSIMDACVVESMTLGDINCWDIEQIRSDLYAYSIQNRNTSCWNLNETVCPVKSKYNSCCKSCDGAIFTSKEELQLAIRNYPFNIVIMSNINCWNVEQITDMSGLLRFSSNFNEVIECWDISQVTNMASMFSDVTSFKQPLNKWNVSQVTNMYGMFTGASSFNQPLNQWDVSQVTYMNLMFSEAFSFNQPINQWNVSQVTDMSEMFFGAFNFNQPLNKWNVSQVTDMHGMITDASSFNQPLNKWNVSQVTDMSRMFYYAGIFNQSLCQWYNKGTPLWRSMFDMFLGSNCEDKEDPNFVTKTTFCARCYAPPLSLPLIRSDIDNLIKSNFSLIPKLVRLAFHDCVDKCDGCVNQGDPFNEGLNIPIDALDNIVKKYTVDQYTGLSRADIWALAALAAANVSQTTVDFPFSWIGRVDCEDDAMQGPNREMPDPDFNTTQVIDYFQAHFHVNKRPFNERQIVALMGAHNLGSAHLDISGFSGSWVIQNDTLTNVYYQNLANPNRTHFFLTDTKRWQWELDGLMMLNADMALVREFEVENDNKAGIKAGQILCPLLVSNENQSKCPFANITKTFVEQYKDNQTLWLHDFKEVFAAMLVNG